jgi:hypothetical protein
LIGGTATATTATATTAKTSTNLDNNGSNEGKRGSVIAIRTVTTALSRFVFIIQKYLQSGL